MNKAILFFIVALLISFNSHAFMQPEERLNDPHLEKQAQSIYAALRCVVCQGQTIDGSDSEIAQAMRSTVREKLLEGLDEDEILSDMKDIYGEQVLNAPPLSKHTFYLWLIPLIAFSLGVMVIVRNTRSQESKNDYN